MAHGKGEGFRKGTIRMYMDGCFDIAHYGHANATRQAKLIGDYLIAGVHSDAEIIRNKGPPVYNENERYRMIEGFRWVDEVVKDAPFSTAVRRLKELDVDIHVHGDDITFSCETGMDCIHAIKSAGLFREVKRTNNVSTTDIVGRILLVRKDHHIHNKAKEEDEFKTGESFIKETRNLAAHYLEKAEMISDFMPRKHPKRGDRIVYTTGAFDILHAGHVDFLKAAAKEGDFLIVGIHTDKCVNQWKGSNHPIMNLFERVLNVLSYKYVDDVIIGVPYKLTSAILDDFKVDIVVHGKTPIPPAEDGTDPYEVAKHRKCFKIIDSGCTLTTDVVIDRILGHRTKYEERNERAEAAFKKQANAKTDKRFEPDDTCR